MGGLQTDSEDGCVGNDEVMDGIPQDCLSVFH